jgi:hypothetical protein
LHQDTVRLVRREDERHSGPPRRRPQFQHQPGTRPSGNNTLPALRPGQDLTLGEWADFYLENSSKPPFRAPKTHEVNQRALKYLRKVFENSKLAELTADDVEMYLVGG